MPSQWTVRLAVVGLVVAGITGAAAFGAFSSVSADRTAKISVATDADALLAIRDGHPNSGLVEPGTNGVLSIRFDRHGGEGVNRDTVVTLGDVNAPTTNHAFSIVNDGNQPRPLDIEFRPEPGFTDGDSGTRNVEVTFHVDRGSDGSADTTLELSEASGDRSIHVADLSTTDTVYVTVRIDTVGLGGNSDLSGSLRIRAGT